MAYLPEGRYRSRIPDFRVLIVPGLNGSGPGHWQSRWQHLYPAFERVEQARWNLPDLTQWSEQIGQVLMQSRRSTLIVAHSFGCLAAMHCFRKNFSNVAGTLLVAPADPARFDLVENLAGARLNCPAVLVGSLNDPWMSSPRAVAWADTWGCHFVSAGRAGHVNADSGLGDWPRGLALLECLAEMAASERNVFRQHDPDAQT